MATCSRGGEPLQSGALGGISVIQQAAQLDVTRGSVNRWLQWFEAAGTESLRPRERPGGGARLSVAQHQQLIAVVEAGPIAAGYQSGLWTGPMIGELIRRRFGVSHHNHHIPRLLHKLGFSVQRPRKRLAKADAERQALWLKQTFPAIKKKAAAGRGIVLFEDEASFWLDGTLHRNWLRIGYQPRVDTFGVRTTAHLFAAVNLCNVRVFRVNV